LDTKVIGKGQTQMIALIERGKRCSTPIAIASMFLVLVYGGGARAAIVTNGDFKVPVVANAQGPNPLDGYLTGGTDAALTGSGVGWSFAPPPGGCAQGNGHAGESGITEQQVASGFAAPAAPVGTQTGWIINLGKIEQQITLTPGNYKLSFEIARRTAGISGGAQTPTPLPIEVRIGAQTFGPFTPASAASFNKVEVPFTILGAAPTSLRFSGTGLAFCPNVENNTTFIAEVSISPEPGPVITSGPTELGPVTPILLEGVHFGSPPGKIKVSFPTPSETPFSDGSKSELHLDTTGVDTEAASPGLIASSLQGSPREQTVDITIDSPDGKLTSNVWHAKFHNDAVITSISPDAITPGRFLLKGWDFDSKEECGSDKTGTVTVFFPTRSPWNLNFSISTPVVIPKVGCTPDTIKIELSKDTAGFVRQTVQISYQSPGGRNSNAMSAQFNPRLQTQVLPWQNVIVVSCSNQSANDQCNPTDPNAPDADLGCFESIDAEGSSSGPAPPDTPPISFQGWHHGCWGISSDTGRDEYMPGSALLNDWFYTGVTVPSPWVENGSVSYTTTPAVINPKGADIVLWVYINWHIGATGGQVYYDGNIMITGPVGVPFN
jgi:hypothetical protein